VSCIVSFEESKYIRPEAFTPVATLRDYADGGLRKDELKTRNCRGWSPQGIVYVYVDSAYG
jgi:hypothetical protein